MSRAGFASAWPEQQNLTNVWTAFGHSYINFTAGTWDQNGRMDALFRSAMRIENSNWANYAGTSARLLSGSMWNSGWLPVHYTTRDRRNAKTWPYVPYGGGALFVWGINDIGNLADSTQTRTAWEHALRAVISRWRASTVRLNTHSSIAYGAGFTSVTGQEERSTTGTLRQATTTTSATITITLPSDYKGETVAICFIGRSGTVGGTVTFSGTAGVTGTISTSDILPSAAAEYCPVVKRITNLTSANAGQTIICTATQMDASGNVLFDTYWLESLTPQPVVVANIARLTTTAYANYYTSTWTGTEAAKDASVQAWNAVLSNLVRNEFDSMVKVADIDRALNKDPDLMAGGSDNQLHPNEHGAAKCVDAFIAAARQLKPIPSRVAKFGSAASYNPTAPAGSARRKPQGQIGYWYGPEFRVFNGTAWTMVSGTIFIYPFEITEPDTRWESVAVETTNTPNAANQVRLFLYADLRNSGYPQHLITEWGPLTFAASTGWKVQSMAWEPDPGLYWIGVKPVNVTATTATLRQVDGPNPYMPCLSSNATPPAASTITPLGWTLTGQGTGAMPTRFPTGATLMTTGPLIALRRAAAG